MGSSEGCGDGGVAGPATSCGGAVGGGAAAGGGILAREDENGVSGDMAGVAMSCTAGVGGGAAVGVATIAGDDGGAGRIRGSTIFVAVVTDRGLVAVASFAGE